MISNTIIQYQLKFYKQLQSTWHFIYNAEPTTIKEILQGDVCFFCLDSHIGHKPFHNQVRDETETHCIWNLHKVIYWCESEE